MLKCSGCSACLNLCPVEAVSLLKNSKGFYSAIIDNDKCINCGLCKKTCPHLNTGLASKSANSKCVLFLCGDYENYISSSSGGAVSTLYKKWAKKGLYFVGVSYDENTLPFYRISNTESDIEAFKGSKYIQAHPKNVFKETEKCLMENKKVLFVGVPCMVSGLRNYLEIKKIQTEKLYTIDLICHGVGSPSVWESYLSYLKKVFKAKVTDYKFRVKQTNNVIAENNTTHHCFMSFENGRNLLDNSIYSHLYQNIYFKQLIMADTCYECKYTSLNRISDLSVGDSAKFKPKTNQDSNFAHSSFLLINTKKGLELLNILKENGSVINICIDEVHQPHLKAPINKPKKYDKFWSTYLKHGFGLCATIYGGKNIISYIKNRAKK